MDKRFFTKFGRHVTAVVLGLGFGLGLATAAHAGTTVFNFQPGDSWRTTTDRLLGQQWAHGNFQNTDGMAVYTPFPTLTGIDALSMWNCGVGGFDCQNASGVVDGETGPTEAFFGYSFNVKPTATIQAAMMAILADDFFHLVVNGVSVAADTLDNRLANNSGLPMVVDLAPYLRDGDNVMSIRVLDGRMKDGLNACPAGASEVSTVLGNFCKEDRAYQWLRVSGSALVVPEPGAGLLAGLALAALVLQRRIGCRKRVQATGPGQLT